MWCYNETKKNADSSENPAKPHTVFIAKVPAYMDRSLKVLGLRQNIDEDRVWHGLNKVEHEDEAFHELFEDPTADKSGKIFTDEDCVKIYNKQNRVKYQF